MRILIADDNKQIASILSDYSIKEGFEVITTDNGEDAVKLILDGEIDIVLLDVMMPKKDGFEVCREVRKQSNVPIIMITARGEDFERIMGLDIGADDYIVKPFSPGEVMARVRAILRRLDRIKGSDSEDKHLIEGSLNISLESFSVLIKNEPVSLTKKEIELLWVLASNKGRVFTRDNLLNMVWGYDYFGDNRTVDSHIKRLRAKVDRYEHGDWRISTIWGVGYKFEVVQDET